MVVNPAAGKGKGVIAGREAAQRLRELGADLTVLTGNTAAETRELLAQATASGPDAVIVVGGDGTLGEASNHLAPAGVPLGIIPAGTGNDFARALGIPQGSRDSATEAASIAFGTTTQAVDVGKAVTSDMQTNFLTIAALGFDANVNERTNHMRWPRGGARYYLALLLELIALKPLDFTIRMGEGPVEHRPGILVAVGNTRSYGGGMPICPDADPCDGVFDVTQVAPLRRLKFLRLFPLLLRAKHLSRPEALGNRTTSLEISAPGLVVYADGERIGSESVKIKLIPAALRVLVPQED